MRLKDLWALLKDSWNAWSTDKAPRLGDRPSLLYDLLPRSPPGHCHRYRSSRLRTRGSAGKDRG